MNLIDSHFSLQSSHSCKLNTVARVVELTYLHVIVKCESLLDGHGKARCTVKPAFQNLEGKGKKKICDHSGTVITITKQSEAPI